MRATQRVTSVEVECVTYQTIPSTVIHNCYAMSAFNNLSCWRNEGTLRQRNIKAAIAEFGYLGLICFGLAECVAKTAGSVLLKPCFGIAASAMSNDAGFAFQTAVSSLSNLIPNVYSKTLETLPFRVSFKLDSKRIFQNFGHATTSNLDDEGKPGKKKRC